MNRPTPPNPRSRKGAMVIGASSVALGLVASVGLLWVTDSGVAAVTAVSESAGRCVTLANGLFAAL